MYDSLLDSFGITRTSPDKGVHVYHIYSVLINNRDIVMAELNKKNIGVSSHYPIPCHLQTGYKSFIKHGSELKVSEEISSTLLSLPLDENITYEQIEYVCHNLVNTIRNSK